MRRLACVATVAICLVAAAGPAAQASHRSQPRLGGPVTDAPLDQGQPAPGIHGSG
jgi:hypothetical protein